MNQLFMGASALVLTSLMASQAFAQAGTPHSADSSVDEVVVTGTRTSGLRAGDSNSPVQVLGNDILKRVGQPDLVQSLAQNIPSLQAQQFGTDEAQFNKAFKLRGVSPNDTLVLVDGERRHGTANVNVAGGAFLGGASADLNYIPLDAIDHVEVLQDGAAAQYGSDAIAGVVNIILKKNTHGGGLSVEGGHYFDQGGLTSDVSGTIGWAPTDKSFLDVTVETKFQGHSFRGDVDPRVLNLNGSTPVPGFGNPVVPANTSVALLTEKGGIYSGAANFPGYPDVNLAEGDGQTQLDNVFYNAGYNVSAALNLYSFGSFGYKNGRDYQNYRLPNVVVNAAGAPLFPDGFDPQENIHETDYSFTIGGKGEVADTTWNLASTYGRNYDRIFVIGSANSSLYAATGSTPTKFHDGDFTSTEWSNNLDLSRDFAVGLTKPITVAGGAEFRIDSYQLRAGDPASYYGTGAQSFFGYAPVDAGYHQRSSYAFYGDVSLNPTKQLNLDGAIRYEDYTDFGSATVYKGTARYDFNDAIAIRGTADTGFRAPTLAEEYYQGINAGASSVSGVFAPNSPGAKFLGLDGLKPEKSVDFSVGLVTHFLPRLTMTLDAYALKINDRIVQSGNFYGYNTTPGITSPSVITALTAAGVTIDPNLYKLASASVSVLSFVNGADTQTYGLDYLASYPMDYGDWGHVNYTLAINYNSTEITKIYAPPTNVNPATVLLNPGAQSYIKDATPKIRGTLGVYWTKGPWSVNLRESVYGSTYSYAQDLRSGVWTKLQVNTAPITDLELGLEVRRNVKLTLGANNLLNKYPESAPYAYRLSQLYVNSATFAGTNSKYLTSSAYGFNGGFYYGRLSLSF